MLDKILQIEEKLTISRLRKLKKVVMIFIQNNITSDTLNYQTIHTTNHTFTTK